MYLTEGVARVSGRAHLDGLASRLPHPPRRITPVPAGRQSWGILPGNCPIRPGWPDPAPGRNRGTRRRPENAPLTSDGQELRDTLAGAGAERGIKAAGARSRLSNA